MTSRSSPSSTRQLARVLGMAVVYYVAGRLALLLAIPPGYATAVWPAAGLAMAGVLLLGNGVWPGVVLGSLLVNFWTSFDATTPAALLNSILLPIAIGTGAAAQALVGAALIRRFVGHPNALTRERDIFLFLGLGGPVSCLTSASIGVTSLLAAGVIEWSRCPFSWWTWWVGDTIGTVLFAPLVLVWTAKPQALWHRRQLSVTVPIALTFALTVVLFVRASAWEHERIEHEFERRTLNLGQSLRKNFDGCIEVLHSIESFVASTPELNRESFRIFVERSFQRHPGLDAVSWNPVVTEARRAGYEATARAAAPNDSLHGFEIREWDADGRLVRAGRRAQYVPIQFMEPLAGNESVLGFDVAADPVRRQTLNRARKIGKPMGTGRIVLSEEIRQPYGLVVFLPVYAHGRPRGTSAEESEYLLGYAGGAIRIGDMMEAAMGGAEGKDIAVRFYDDSAPAAERLLYADRGRSSEPESLRVAGDQKSHSALHSETRFEMAGRQWTLEFSATPDYLTVLPWQAWGVLAFGLVFTGLLGALLLVVTGRTVEIGELVASRTAELEQANENLISQIAERQQIEAALIESRDLTEASRRDLETLLHVISHDLKEPLRGIAGFSEMVRTHYADRLDSSGRDFLARINGEALRMRRLLDDVLTLARARREELATTEVEGMKIVESAIERLVSTIQKTEATVWVAEDLPRLRVEPTWAVQAVFNLLSNALKFTRGGRPPEVDVIGYQPRAGEPCAAGLVVKDRGPGVAPEHEERIFQLFQRGVGREVEGTGAGLAIVKAVAERHGGRAWVRSRDGGGTEFVITFEKAA